MSDHETLVAEGIDLSALAKQGADIWFEMIFRDRFYHADPHPGNLMVLPEGVAGILDSGMVGRIDKRMLADLEDLVIAYVNKDVELIADVAMRICDPPRGFDRKRFEAEIGYIVDDLLDRPVEQIDMVELGNAIIGVIRNFQLNIPSNYFIFIKTVAMLEGTSRALDMNFNLAELLMPYVQEIISRRFSLRNLMQSMLRSYRDWDRLIHLLPVQLADILDQAKTGEFSFNMEVKGLDRIINRLIFGMIATGLILASALLWNAGVGPFFEEFSLLGAVGIVFALYIVYRLWRSINRSGGL
jgi:ubiquinone biosynthesis protein